jgi:hypothetical protein
LQHNICKHKNQVRNFDSVFVVVDRGRTFPSFSITPVQQRCFSLKRRPEFVNFTTIVPQFEYGDFYKFIVSIGIALIISAVLLPWLFLREPFDLLLDSNQLARLTPSAQTIIAERHYLFTKFFHLVPWVSLVQFLTGMILACWGLMQWSHRQVLRDEGEDLGFEIQRRKLKAMSPEQLDAKVEADLEEEPAVLGSRAEIRGSTRSILDVERAFHSRLIQCFGNSHKISLNQRLGTAEFDLILASRDAGEPDIIIELKYIRHGFHSGWLRDVASLVALSGQYYSQNLRRKAVSLLIIITADSANVSQEMFIRLRQRLPQSLTNVETGCRIEVLAEHDIPSVNCASLGQLIFG